MRTTSLIGFSLLVLLVTSTFGQGPHPLQIKGQEEKYKKAYEVGAKEAQKELEEGQATLYVYGLRMQPENLDRETGLPYRGIAGCFVNVDIIGRAAGHNATITQSIKEHGVPKNSFKRWEDILFDLKGYYDSRTKTEKTHPLTLGGPSVESPDQRFKIRPVKIASIKNDGSPGTRLGVAVSVDGVEREPLMIYWDEGATDFIWGPQDSGFAVIRCKSKDGSSYLALDMNRGFWFREEHP